MIGSSPAAPLTPVPVAEFQDPIKALLGVAVHRDTRVIIKRRFVQGGGPSSVLVFFCDLRGADTFFLPQRPRSFRSAPLAARSVCAPRSARSCSLVTAAISRCPPTCQSIWGFFLISARLHRTHPFFSFCNRMAGEPQLAASDLAIKLDFQKKQLDRKLVDLGYEAIMCVPLFGLFPLVFF